MRAASLPPSYTTTGDTTKPGIRAFGAFAAHDTFVLLTWEYRGDIPNFDAEVDRCKRDWAKYFNGVGPFKGNRLNEYLSNYYAV